MASRNRVVNRTRFRRGTVETQFHPRCPLSNLRGPRVDNGKCRSIRTAGAFELDRGADRARNCVLTVAQACLVRRWRAPKESHGLLLFRLARAQLGARRVQQSSFRDGDAQLPNRD